MTAKLNTQILVVGCGASSSMAGAVLAALQDAMVEFEIVDPNAQAAFLSNVGVESGGFVHVVENLSYTAARLAVVWPFRYAEDPHVANPVPNALARSLAGNPQDLANNVYANRLGNGAPSTGDGWNFRGQGYIQLTGKSEVLSCFKALGVNFAAQPGYLQSIAGAARSAAWFFAVGSKAMSYAIACDFPNCVRAINGQLPCPANQGDLRDTRYRAALALLSAD